VLGRCMGKPSPARCSRASPSPRPAQCCGRGRRTDMPSRNVTIAAGRPARRRQLFSRSWGAPNKVEVGVDGTLHHRDAT
jgi:hypothetical protein